MWHETAIENRMLRTILEKGILAPSGDNIQPWRFRLREDEIDIFLHHGHEKIHFFEVGNKSLYISAGAVIENIRVTAAHLGYQLLVSYLPDPQNLSQVATLRFEKVPQSGHPHSIVLDRRVTNRKFYSLKRKINPSVYEKLEGVASKEKGFRLFWLKKEDHRYSNLCRLIGAADQLRYENKKIHLEFIETIRFSDREAQKTRDGLNIKTFEAGPFGALLFRLVRSWNYLSILNYFGMSRLFNLYTQIEMQFSQAAGLIVADNCQLEDYVRGGEVMERIWHEITAEGLAIQPMSALPIFIIDLIVNQGRDFSVAQRQKLNELKDKFFSLFGINGQNALILLFRIGYAAPPSARSLRRPLESFIMKDEITK